MKRIGTIWRECTDFTLKIAEQEGLTITFIRDIFGLCSFAIDGGDESRKSHVGQKLMTFVNENHRYFAATPLRFLKDEDALTTLIKQTRIPLKANSRAFIVDRLLFNESWKSLSSIPPNGLPPVVNFYSFKGGVGRSTCAALTALLMAREGKKVFLLDLDLEAPGIEDFFFSKEEVEEQLGGGIVDFLVEHKIFGPEYDPNIRDFVLTYADPEVTNSGGSLMIVPAGILNQTYIDLLGRVNVPDLARTMDKDNPLIALLKRLNQLSKADCMITDCRTGFTDLGGLTLNGLSTLDVLVFKAGERDRRFLPIVLEQIQKFHQKGVEPESLAQRFLILFSMVEMPAKKNDQLDFENELRSFVKEACYEKIFSQFKETYTYPDDLAEDSPLEPVPHDFLKIEYLSAFNRAVLADDLDQIQAQQIDSPYNRLVRRIVDVKLHRFFGEEAHRGSTSLSDPKNYPALDVRTKALGALGQIVASPSGEDDFQSAESFPEKFLIRNVYQTLLELDSFIILGRKGAGKSALFQLLKQPNYLQELAKYLKIELSHLDRTTWAIGFVKNEGHPHSGDFLALSEELSDKLSEELSNKLSDKLVSFWRTFAAFRLAQEDWDFAEDLRKVLPSYKECFTKFNNLEVRNYVDDFFDHLNKHLKDTNRFSCLSYDDLDVGLSSDSATRGKFLSSLVIFWQEMRSRCKHIKAKIFLREDLWFQEVKTADKSKIRDTIDRVTISWNGLDIYRVLVKRAGQLPEVQDYWKSLGLWESQWTEMLASPLGFVPPNDEPKIRQLVASLAGEAMASGSSGYKKGYVYTWILRHLSDAKDMLRPRQVLLLFSAAAKSQLKPQETGGLLSPASIRNALKKDVSEASVADLRAEFLSEWSVDKQWLPDTFTHFVRVWPVEEDQLRQFFIDKKVEPEKMLSKMTEAGLLRHSIHKGKKTLQIPDIYLYGLGLSRHG